jgi:hypothetical protein
MEHAFGKKCEQGRVNARYCDEEADREPGRLEQSKVDPVGVHDHCTHHHGGSGADGEDLEPARADSQAAEQRVNAGPDNAKQSPNKQQIQRVRHGELPHRESVVTGDAR